MAKCVRNLSTGWVRHWSLLEDPPFDPGTEELIEAESLDAAKPLDQVAFESVPSEVSPLQAKIALSRAGYLDNVEQVVEAWGLEAVIAYRNALTFRRDSPMLLAIAASIPGLPEDLDDIFRAAALIAV